MSDEPEQEPKPGPEPEEVEELVSIYSRAGGGWNGMRALARHVKAVRDAASLQAWYEGHAKAHGYDLSYHLDREEWHEEFGDELAENPYEALQPAEEKTL